MLQRPAVRAARGRSQFLGHRCIRFANPAIIQRRTFLRSRDSGSGATYDSLNVERLARERRDYERTRLIFLATGSVAGLIAMGYTAWQLKKVLEQNPKKLDVTGSPSPLPPNDPLSPRKVVVHDKDGREIVPTGNSTVPEFPRTIDLPLQVIQGPSSSASASVSASPSRPSPSQVPPPAVDTIVLTTPEATGSTTEYTLVGLGTRTVSFLSIQVYVVGFYIATADIASLQNRLIKRVNPIATTLVASEKDELRKALLDPAEGEAVWEELLQEGIPARSLFRIVPVRDTDFHHLRDGFVRAIQGRAPKILAKEQEQTEVKDAGAAGVPGTVSATAGSQDFGDSVRQFRQAFNRGKAPKQRELLIVRADDGTLSVVYDDGRSFGRQFLGSVSDERLSRALWLNYLGGSKVASEPARKSIVDGVIEFVERPVGTVATQVV